MSLIWDYLLRFFLRMTYEVFIIKVVINSVENHKNICQIVFLYEWETKLNQIFALFRWHHSIMCIDTKLQSDTKDLKVFFTFLFLLFSSFYFLERQNGKGVPSALGCFQVPFLSLFRFTFWTYIHTRLDEYISFL